MVRPLDSERSIPRIAERCICRGSLLVWNDRGFFQDQRVEHTCTPRASRLFKRHSFSTIGVDIRWSCEHGMQRLSVWCATPYGVLTGLGQFELGPNVVR